MLRISQQQEEGIFVKIQFINKICHKSCTLQLSQDFYKWKYLFSKIRNSKYSYIQEEFIELQQIYLEVGKVIGILEEPYELTHHTVCC